MTSFSEHEPMRKAAENLYGSAPDKARAALLLIDVINDFDFPERRQLLRHAAPMARRLAKLKHRAKVLGYSAIYVNDNFGRWRSDFKSLVQHCLNESEDSEAKQFVRLLRPEADDYFILKPAHSGFYSTTLELLLERMRSEILIITGLATNICVLFTANDAYLRGYRVAVPRDCVAANSMKLSRDALTQMRTVLKADCRESRRLPLADWLKQSPRAAGHVATNGSSA